MAYVSVPFRADLLSAYLSSATVKAQLVDEGAYTPSSAHDFLDDVPGGARIGTAVTLASKTFTSGVFDAADFVVTAVTGATVEGVVFYVDVGGSDATRRIIAYLNSGAGLPFTPNGGDANVSLPTGILALEDP